MKMGLLSGKKILFCRPQEDSKTFLTAFRKKGVEISFFAPYRIELNPPGIESSLEILKQIATFDWLILSSPNGVNALFHFLKQIQIKVETVLKLHIGTVGNKAAERLRELAPETTISLQAADLQTLLNRILSVEPRKSIKILHTTSVQSLQNISVSVHSGAELQRVPLYQTVVNQDHSSEGIERIRSGYFDVIVFSSPTSFNYFREIMDDSFSLRVSAIAAFGKTTANHIRQKGFQVKIIPAEPTPSALVNAMNKHFSGIELSEGN